MLLEQTTCSDKLVVKFINSAIKAIVSFSFKRSVHSMLVISLYSSLHLFVLCMLLETAAELCFGRAYLNLFCYILLKVAAILCSIAFTRALIECC